MRQKINLYKERLKRFLKNYARSSLGLFSPYDTVICILEAHGLLPKKIVGLELFGCHGLWTTADYIEYCSKLDFYEVNPYYAQIAKKRFGAKIVLHQEDSIERVQSGSIKERYNFIVIDNPAKSPYGSDVLETSYFENFSLFPDIFSVCGDEAVLLINLLCNPYKYCERVSCQRPGDDWIKERRNFFSCSKKEDTTVTVARGLESYINKIPSNFKCTFSFVLPRNKSGDLFLLAICVKKYDK